MALIKADRVKESSTSTGASTFALAGAYTGFRAFSSVCSVGDTFYYVIDSDSGSEWETGLGTYSATNTLTRTTVYASSNSGSIVTFSAGTKNVYISLTGRQIDTVSASPPASTGAPPLLESLAGAAHTALTASTEYNDIYWNLARTVQFSTGAITTQRAVRIAAPTYSFVAASTITTAATVQIDGAPVAGTNATITNTMALRIAGIAGTKGISLSSSTSTNNAANNAIEVAGSYGTGFQVRWSAGYTLIGSATHRDSSAQLSICQSLIAGTALSIANSSTNAASESMNVYNSSGTKVLVVTYNGCLTVQPGALSAVTPTPCQTITGPAHTSLTASTEYSDVYWNLARTVEFATGAIATQRAVRIAAPTYAFVAASTITDATTFQIDGSPVAGTNATITNQSALKVLAGVAAAKGIIVQGAPSQSGNLTEWQNNAGSVLSAINSAGNFTGTASNVSGTVAIANGGTGTTTAQLAINALAGAVTSGSYLRGNGTNVVMATIQAADVPTLNQNTTGTASGSVSGTASYVPKFTSANVVGNSVIYDNGTNIGIGTASPTGGRLHVKSSSGGGNFVIYVENSSGFQIGGLYQNISGHGALFIANSAGSYQAVVSASGDSYILQPLGVGISVPAAQLHVTSAAAATKGLIVRGASAQSANLQEWQNNAGTVLALIDSAGYSKNQGINGIREKVTVSATAATGTINYEMLTQSVLYYTTNASGNFTLNVRGDGSNSLNSQMNTGDSLTIAFLVTNGATAYYQTAMQIDSVAVTPKWQGGTAPSAGNTSSIDVYTYTVIKTGNAAFTVLAAQTKFA